MPGAGSEIAGAFMPAIAGWAGKQIFGAGNPSSAQSGLMGEMQDVYNRQMAVYNGTNMAQRDATNVALAKGMIDRGSQAALNEAQARFGDGNMPDSQRNQMESSIAAQGADQISQLASNLASTEPQRQAALLPNSGYGGLGSQTGLAGNIDAANYRAGQAGALNWGVIGSALGSAINAGRSPMGGSSPAVYSTPGSYGSDPSMPGSSSRSDGAFTAPGAVS